MSGTTAASGWAHLGSGSMLGVAGAPPWASWPVDPRVVVPVRVYVQMRGRSGFTAVLQRPPCEKAQIGRGGSPPAFTELLLAVIMRPDANTGHFSCLCGL